MKVELSFPDCLQAATEAPVADPDQQTSIEDELDSGWIVIVWNDPVNLMSYVVHVFQQVLGFDQGTAKRHMLEVHEKGKSCVARETREKAEHYWNQLQQRGLKTTIEKES
jgi:ATP-dependent Clp protease adaptor protein ClpS